MLASVRAKVVAATKNKQVPMVELLAARRGLSRRQMIAPTASPRPHLAAGRSGRQRPLKRHQRAVKSGSVSGPFRLESAIPMGLKARDITAIAITFAASPADFQTHSSA
jgi:hypothetical protein